MTKQARCANWTRTEKERLVALAQAGKTPKEISITMTRSVISVRRQIRLLAPGQAGSTKQRWSVNEDAQLIMAINDDCRVSRIAHVMNRSIPSVRSRLKWLRKNGAPVKASIVTIVAGESEVARRAIEAAITPEDLAWMQHYRQQAAKRQQGRAVA